MFRPNFYFCLLPASYLAGDLVGAEFGHRPAFLAENGGSDAAFWLIAAILTIPVYDFFRRLLSRLHPSISRMRLSRLPPSGCTSSPSFRISV
jgi:hypothetical protein